MSELTPAPEVDCSPALGTIAVHLFLMTRHKFANVITCIDGRAAQSTDVIRRKGEPGRMPLRKTTHPQTE